MPKNKPEIKGKQVQPRSDDQRDPAEAAQGSDPQNVKSGFDDADFDNHPVGSKLDPQQRKMVRAMGFDWKKIDFKKWFDILNLFLTLLKSQPAEGGKEATEKREGLVSHLEAAKEHCEDAE